MPVFEAKTQLSESVWKSPDGQREIFKVTLDIDGHPMVAKTYSKDISVIGWAGSVESYEKPGRNGAETFVKQPPKEDGGYSPRGATQGGGGSKPFNRPAQDQFTMYLSYAKDIAVAMLKDGKLDEGEYGKVLDAVSNGGDVLYNSRPDAPKKDVNVDPAELDTVIDPDAALLNDLFPPEV